MAAKKKRKYTRRTDDKEVTVKNHARQVWGLFVWAKNNPWVFAMIAGFWGTIATTGLTLAIRVAAPIVRPIVDKELEKQSKPYIVHIDGVMLIQNEMISDLNDRIDDLEACK